MRTSIAMEGFDIDEPLGPPEGPEMPDPDSFFNFFLDILDFVKGPSNASRSRYDTGDFECASRGARA